jgi:hypothetical protein
MCNTFRIDIRKLPWKFHPVIMGCRNRTSYTLQYKTTAATTWNEIQNITPIPIHQNLTPNTNYVWKIQAACAGGTTSTYSGEGAFNSGFAPVTSPGPRSLSFNGSTQYLNAGQFNLNGNALTFEGWVKVNI